MKEGTSETRANKVRGPRRALQAPYHMPSSPPPSETEPVTPLQRAGHRKGEGFAPNRDSGPGVCKPPLLQRTLSVPSHPGQHLQVLCPPLTQPLEEEEAANGQEPAHSTPSRTEGQELAAEHRPPAPRRSPRGTPTPSGGPSRQRAPGPTRAPLLRPPPPLTS